MKKVILSLGMVLCMAGAAVAQEKKAQVTAKNPAATEALKTSATPTTRSGAGEAAVMVFKSEVHDFGTVPEGPTADYEFTFTNTGKDPVVLDRVQASCGCTTPTWTKEPILPGKTGVIKATYNTQGRPGPFTKTITAFTKDHGTKVLTIKGTVEKGPAGSVPENNSMIKTH